jgi:hypothetical protein
MSDAATLEVAFPRFLVALKVHGAEQTINEHPVTLLAFEAEPALRTGGTRESVRKNFAFLVRQRLKPIGAGCARRTSSLGCMTSRSRAMNPATRRR